MLVVTFTYFAEGGWTFAEYQEMWLLVLNYSYIIWRVRKRL